MKSLLNGVAVLAVLWTGAAMAQARPPAPLTDQETSDGLTCLIDEKAMAPDVVAACTRLLEGKTLGGDKMDIADVYTARAHAEIELKQNDKALADAEKAIQNNPNQADARFIRAASHIDDKKYDLAIQDFDVTIAADPMDAFALFDRGIAKYRLGNKAGGDADFTAAKAIEPTIVEDMAKRGIKP